MKSNGKYMGKVKHIIIMFLFIGLVVAGAADFQITNKVRGEDQTHKHMCLNPDKFDCIVVPCVVKKDGKWAVEAVEYGNRVDETKEVFVIENDILIVHVTCSDENCHKKGIVIIEPYATPVYPDKWSNFKASVQQKYSENEKDDVITIGKNILGVFLGTVSLEDVPMDEEHGEGISTLAFNMYDSKEKRFNDISSYAIKSFYQYLEGKITQETISDIIVDEAENIYGPLDEDSIKTLRLDIEKKLLNFKDGSWLEDIYFNSLYRSNPTYWDF